MSDLHEAAFRAGLWQTIEQRAKELKDAAKAELSALQPGDAVAGSWDGRTIARAIMSVGRTRLVVTDQTAFVNWVAGHYPTEIVSQVNPAFIRQIESRSRDLGAPVDHQGEVIPGLSLCEGDPYVSVRRAPDALAVIAELLESGRLSLDGVREIEAADG